MASFADIAPEQTAPKYNILIGAAPDTVLGLQTASIALEVEFARYQNDSGGISEYTRIGVPLLDTVAYEGGGYIAYKGWGLTGGLRNALGLVLGLGVMIVESDSVDDRVVLGPQVGFGAACSWREGGPAVGALFSVCTGIDVTSGESWGLSSIDLFIVWGAATTTSPGADAALSARYDPWR